MINKFQYYNIDFIDQNISKERIQELKNKINDFFIDEIKIDAYDINNIKECLRFRKNKKYTFVIDNKFSYGKCYFKDQSFLDYKDMRVCIHKICVVKETDNDVYIFHNELIRAFNAIQNVVVYEEKLINDIKIGECFYQSEASSITKYMRINEKSRDYFAEKSRDYFYCINIDPNSSRMGNIVEIYNGRTVLVDF